MWWYCRTLWPWPLMNCCSAEVQCVFFLLFLFPKPYLIIWTNYQRNLQINVPKVLGYGFLWEGTLCIVPLPCSSSDCSMGAADWCSVCASNCQETSVGAVQNMTQISSGVSRRAITLLRRSVTWLVIQPGCVCMSFHTRTRFPVWATSPLHLQSPLQDSEYYAENSL